MRSVRLCAALCALWLGACAGPRLATAPVRDLPKGLELPKPRSMYGAAPETHPQEAEWDALGKSFEAALAEERRTLLQRDKALDEVAATWARIYGTTGQPPAESFGHWLLWRLAVPASELRATASAAEGPQAKEKLAAQLAELARSMPALDAPAAWGVARVELPGPRHVVAVVLQERRIALNQLPKRVFGGGVVTVAGRVAVSLDDLRCHFDRGENDILSVPLPVDGSGRFAAHVQVPPAPGRYFLEITGTAKGEQQPRRLALLPLYVEQDEPSAADDFVRQPRANPPDETRWGAHLLSLYNARRRQLELPPLRSSPALDALAARIAAGAPLPADFEETLAKQGIEILRADQAVTPLEFLDEAAQLNLLSPARRARVLDKAVTLAGVAAARREGRLVLAEVLAVPLPPLDPVAEAKRLFDTANALRGSAKLPQFDSDPAMSEHVASFAARVCAGELAPDAVDVLWSSLHATGVRWGRAGASYIVLRHLDDEQLRKSFGALLASDYQRLAIGVCRGDVKGSPRSQYVVFAGTTSGI